MSGLKTLIDETIRYLAETTDDDIGRVEDYVMMDAFKAGLNAIDPSKYTLQLVLNTGTKDVNLIKVSIHDPIAIDLVRDQIIAIISGLQQRKSRK